MEKKRLSCIVCAARSCDRCDQKHPELCGKVINIIIIGMIIPLFIGLVGVLNLWKNVYLIKGENMATIVQQSLLPYRDEQLNHEIDVYDILTSPSTNQMSGSLQYLLVYDTEKKEDRSNLSDSERQKVLKHISEKELTNYRSDGFYHIFYKYGDRFIIYSRFSEAYEQYLVHGSISIALHEYGIGLAIFLFCVFILSLVKIRDEVRSILYDFLIMLWIAIYSVTVSLPVLLAYEFTDASIIDQVYKQTNSFKIVEDFVIQNFMIILLALVLIIYSHRYDSSIMSSTKGTHHKGIQFMRAAILIKCLADSLISVISVPVLKQVTASYGSQFGSLLNTVVLSAAGFLGALVTAVIPWAIKKAGNSVLYFRVSLAISLLGSMLCFYFKDSTYYIIGFLVIVVGDTFSAITFLIFPFQFEDRKTCFKYISFFAVSRLIGTIIGFVISGILSCMVGTRVLFLYAAGLIALCIFTTFGIPTEILVRKLQEGTNLKEVLSMRKVWRFIFLMLIPFGFINYFFSYKIPLDVKSMGATTTLISLLFFMRYVMMFIFKGSDQIKNFWKRFSPEAVIFVNMMQLALLFSLYYFFSNLFMLFFVTIMLAFVQTRFSSYMAIYGFEAAGNEEKSFFGTNTVRSFGTKIGATLAPPLVTKSGLFVLPLIMSICATVHFLFCKAEKRNGSSC